MATSAKKKTRSKKRQQKPAFPECLDGLTSKQTVAMNALIGGATNIEAAKLAGVSVWTVSHWLNSDTVFKTIYKELRRQVVTALLCSVASEAGKSIRFLAKVRDDEGAPLSTRTRAASDLLRLAKVEEPPPLLELMSPDEYMALVALEARTVSIASADRREHAMLAAGTWQSTPEGKALVELRAKMNQLKSALPDAEDNVRDLQDRLNRAKLGDKGMKKLQRDYTRAFDKLEEIRRQLRKHSYRESQLSEQLLLRSRSQIPDAGEFVADAMALPQIKEKCGMEALELIGDSWLEEGFCSTLLETGKVTDSLGNTFAIKDGKLSRTPAREPVWR